MLVKLPPYPGPDPMKLFFFANEEFFPFFAGKLECLLHIAKIN